MKVYMHSHWLKTALVATLAVLAIVVVALIIGTLRDKPEGNGNAPAKNDNSKMNGGEQPPPDKETTPGDKQPPVDADTPPAKTPPKIDGVCEGNVIASDEMTLLLPVYVYITAMDAKNKSNPALTYHPGRYYIFKCYEGMVNITHTQGLPGGWIDPKNPYQTPAVTPVPAPAPSVPSVMTIDNATVNWSHEYPSAYVKNYNGLWNLSPSNLYLTFDCGYDYNSLVATIMDTLSAKGVKAVFFVTGDYMNARPDLVLRMVREGHVVGNHSYVHLNQPESLAVSTDTVIADIRAWGEKYVSITGSNPSALYFRPPGGAVSLRSMALMDQLGYTTVLWGAAYRDWDTTAQPTQDAAMTLLRQYTTPGDIVLLHGVSQTSADILGQYIDEYRGKGFTFALP